METDIKKNYIEHESTNLLLKVDVNKKNGEYPLFIQEGNDDFDLPDLCVKRKNHNLLIEGDHLFVFFGQRCEAQTKRRGGLELVDTVEVLSLIQLKQHTMDK